MTDNRSPQEATANNCDPHTYTTMSNTNENRQTQGTPSNPISPNINARTAFNFGNFGMTAERSRMFTDISSTIERNWPLIQNAPTISLTSFLMHGLQHSTRPVELPNNYTINLEEHPNLLRAVHFLPPRTTSRNESTHQHHVHEAVNIPVEGQNNNNNDDNDLDNIDNDRINPEIRATLIMLQQYIPFVLILLVKFLYDHKTGILMFVALMGTFIFANNNLKREIVKQHDRNSWLLILVLSYIVIFLTFVAYMLELHTLVPYAQPLTICDLLCHIVVMDLILKLITIVCKILLACLPMRLLAFQNRGKYYLMIEATSQLYRCVAPIQPCLYYFFETYQGPEKIVGILFLVAYLVVKGGDLLSRLKLFRTAIWKVYQNVNLGVSPSKEQLAASGGICAICHDKYSTPVRLHCKHIFCEVCVSTWLDRKRSCPLCRASITDNPLYRNGHTTHFIQLY